jgi:hypothetical protein
MLALSFIPRPHPHRGDTALPALSAPTFVPTFELPMPASRVVSSHVNGSHVIGSRFESPRASLTAAPSFSRPNLFAGD